MRDELVDFELARHVVVDKIGQLAATLDATKCAALMVYYISLALRRIRERERLTFQTRPVTSWNAVKDRVS